MPLGILIDENLHPALEEPLRARGHRADHAQSIGMASRPDPELLDAARRYGCFMTADRLQDRDSKIAAYRFMRDGNRIIHFGQSPHEPLRLAVQHRYLRDQVAEIEQLAADPGGPLMIKIINRGRELAFRDADHVHAWLAEYDPIS